jgi:hypothetical protein
VAARLELGRRVTQALLQRDLSRAAIKHALVRRYGFGDVEAEETIIATLERDLLPRGLAHLAAS